MEIVILQTFLFSSLFLLGYAFFNKKVIYLAAITSFLLVLLGADVLANGITYTTHDTVAQSWLQQTVGNATVYNTTSSIISAYSDTVTTWNDIYTSAYGMFIVLLGIMTLYLTITYLKKGSEEDREE
jgi:uncharacterized membrane protein